MVPKPPVYWNWAISRTYSIIVALLGWAAHPKQLHESPQWQLCFGACWLTGAPECEGIGVIGIDAACCWWYAAAT